MSLLQKMFGKRQNRTHPYCAALIAAAGSSTRYGGENKLLQTLDGIPVLVRTLLTIDRVEGIDEIVIAAREFRGCLETAGDAVIRLADTVERRCRREGWGIFFRPARFTMESRTVRHWHIMCRRCGDQMWNIWVCVHTVEVDRCGWRKESRRGERAE